MFASVGPKFLVLTIEIALYIVSAAWIFGAKLHFDISFLMLFVTGAVSFSGLGLISAAFVMYFKKGDPVNWGVIKRVLN